MPNPGDNRAEWMGRSLGGVVGVVYTVRRSFIQPLRSSGLRGLRSRKWREVDQADGERFCEWGRDDGSHE